MLDTRSSPTTTPQSSRPRVAVWLLAGLAAFQVLVAALLYLQREEFIRRATGTWLARNHEAAVSAYHGTLAVHVALAVVFAVCTRRIRRRRRADRIRVSVPLTLTAIGGVAALWLPTQAWLSPVGVVLAVAALAVIWLPTTPTTDWTMS